MVSLISQSTYIKQIESDESNKALVDFLYGRSLDISSKLSLSNANNILLYALNAIQKNDRNSFIEAHGNINHRQPNPDSDWIYNDILLFSLVLGVKKFELEKTPLLKILNTRSSQSDTEKELVTQTFEDVLKNNFESIDNYQPLMLVMKYYLDVSLGDEETINNTYLELVEREFPIFKAPFLNLISLKAINIILLSKNLIDWERQKAIVSFIESYEKRTRQMATIIWLCCVIIVVILSFGFLNYYLTSSPQQADVIARFLTILSVVGIGSLLPVVALINSRKKIIDKLSKPFHRFYGYRLDENNNPS